MKKNILKGILLFITVFFFGCEQQDCCAPFPERNELPGGEWLLYETGYSPGSGYIINEVPPEPTQKAEFLADGTLITSVESWKDYKFYLILDDPQSDSNILSLYTQPTSSDDVTKLKTSYTISFEEGKLKLYYRWCIEGCHMGFKPV
jgi:hypothetical protein